MGPRCTLQITKTVLGLWILPGPCGVCPHDAGPWQPWRYLLILQFCPLIVRFTDICTESEWSLWTHTVHYFFQ